MQLRSSRIFAVCAIALALTLTPLAGPAFAGHGGEANSGTPDNKEHCVDRNSIGSDVEDAVAHGIAQLDRSDMDAKLSCSGDVEVYDDYYGTAGDWNGKYGRTNCEDWEFLHRHCDVYRIRYNLTYFAGYSSGQVKSGGCHEFGHTAGLGHRTDADNTYDNSCMWASVSSDRQNFDTHDLDAINEEVA